MIEAGLRYDPMVVLEQVFVPGFDQDIAMLSGRTLRATTTPDEIYIRDMDNPGYHFDAAVSAEGDASAIFLSIDTKDRGGDNRTHPDLYAARLLGRAVRFFDAGPYGALDRVEGTWVANAGSDNFAQYIANLSQFGPGPYTQEQMRIAAKGTWTGSRLHSLGFTDVTSVRLNKNKHTQVYFDRPAPLAA